MKQLILAQLKDNRIVRFGSDVAFMVIEKCGMIKHMI